MNAFKHLVQNRSNAEKTAIISAMTEITVDSGRGAMKSFKGGMQDRNLGPLLPDDFFFLLTFNKKLRETE